MNIAFSGFVLLCRGAVVPPKIIKSIMKIVQNTRSGLRIIAIFGVAILILGFGVSQASAATPDWRYWSLRDSFEISPASTWSITGGGYVYGDFFTDDLSLMRYSRTGQTGAYITTRTGGWTGVGRFVDLTPFVPGITAINSQVTIYVRPRATSATNVHIALEVIDPDTWTYVSLKQVVLSGFTWQPVVTDIFTPIRKTIYVRLSISVPTTETSQQAADVDDLLVAVISI